MKFTEEQVSSIMYDDGIYDKNEKTIFQKVSEKVISHDIEKSSITKRIVIKELSTGKHFAAELGESPWIGQDEYNAEQEWTEVKPRKITKTVFE